MNIVGDLLFEGLQWTRPIARGYNRGLCTLQSKLVSHCAANFVYGHKTIAVEIESQTTIITPTDRA